MQRSERKELLDFPLGSIDQRGADTLTVICQTASKCQLMTLRMSLECLHFGQDDLGLLARDGWPPLLESYNLGIVVVDRRWQHVRWNGDVDIDKHVDRRSSSHFERDAGLIVGVGFLLGLTELRPAFQQQKRPKHKAILVGISKVRLDVSIGGFLTGLCWRSIAFMVVLPTENAAMECRQVGRTTQDTLAFGISTFTLSPLKMIVLADDHLALRWLSYLGNTWTIRLGTKRCQAFRLALFIARLGG